MKSSPPLFRVLVASLLALALCGCQTTSVETASVTVRAQAPSASESLRQIHDAMVAELRPYDLSLRNLLGDPVPVLPPDSLAHWQAVALRAATFRAGLEAIEDTRLDADERLTRDYLIRLAQSLEAYPEAWWYSFPVTPYAGGWRHNSIRQAAVNSALQTTAQREHYLAAMRAYAAHIRSQAEKLAQQATRGIRIAGPAVPGARQVATNLGAAATALVPGRERLGGLDDAAAEQFRAEVAVLVEAEVRPAFAALGAVLDEDYAAAAPEQVGLMWQPGGAGQYRELVRLHTGTALSPEQIHAIGKDILREAQAELEQIKAQVGFTGSDREFAALVDADPRFAASTPAEVEAHFARAMQRIEPILPRYFSLLPKAAYAVERAPPQVEQGMTFGFYRAPTEKVPVGAYVYNGADPAGRSYANAAALIYHELLPGHHFQIALQLENEALPLLRRANAFLPLTAYVEGWAEYAADLAGDMGMYPTPYERFGRLYSTMFIANRLVVDTGLNALGWTLDEARTFMREHTFASEAEIESELLRYSSDIPGQALAYGMGQRELLRMRSEAQAALGEAFNFPAFHAEVLAPGALPMDLLDARLKAWQAGARE